MSRVVVAGGAGFLGSHLCDLLVGRGDQVECVDDLTTGSRSNVAHLEGNPLFTLHVADVVHEVPVDGHVDAVCHLASPASPPAYLARPLETLAVGSEGTRRLIDLALASDARFLLASTSEVYGDPVVHPQVETYRGNVDPVGPRSVYDEAKRFAEALTMAAHRARGLDVGIVRIFNTYGPRLAAGDGRVVSNFITQAVRGEPLTVYGDGTQTRSLCFVADEVRGLLALLDSAVTGPVNIGNPDERSVLELAHKVLEVTGSPSGIVHCPLPTDDPTRRCPDISLARRLLGWEPAVSLDEGLALTVSHLAEQVGAAAGRADEPGRAPMTAAGDGVMDAGDELRAPRYRTLSVILPVYNEQPTVAEIIRRMRAAPLPPPLVLDIVAVDDASTDGSDKVLATIGDSTVRVLTHQRNQGKGAAIRTAMAHANGDLILIQDADLEYDPADWGRLLDPILKGKAQVVYGSRFTGERKNMLPLHWVGNRFLSLVTNLLYSSTLSDMETCYKLFDRQVLEGITIESNRFDFEPEITARLLRRGHRIYEVPVSYAGREVHEGKKITWRDGITALRTLVRFRFSRRY